MKKTLYLSLAALLGVLGYLALGQATLPEGPGKDLVLAKCQSCHEIGLVARERLSRDRWDGVIEEMELQGLKLTQEERAAILDYLATYLGLTPPPETPPAPVAQTPKTGAQVYAACSGCHGPQGEGNPPNFPPLKGHVEALLKAQGGREYLALAVLFGLGGKITVLGQTYENLMPGFAWLSDEEIALVLNHLASWGAPEGFTPYTPEEIRTLRAKELTPEKVLEARKALNLP